MGGGLSALALADTILAMMLRHTIVLLLIAVLATGCAARFEPRPEPNVYGEGAGSRAGAVAANIWYVPGRALTCGGAAILAGVVLTVTFGYSYESASELMHGGCSGPWVLHADDV